MLIFLVFEYDVECPQQVLGTVGFGKSLLAGEFVTVSSFASASL